MNNFSMHAIFALELKTISLGQNWIAIQLANDMNFPPVSSMDIKNSHLHTDKDDIISSAFILKSFAWL
jgi:hypothetical protein